MGPWLNADEYARRRWGPGHDLEYAYEAARFIDDQRRSLMARRESFTTETVFSHPSKLELVTDLEASGYQVWLEIVVVPVDISIERVAHRVAAGGHDVPEDKIRERARRADLLLGRAIPLVSHSRIWQNITERDPLDPSTAAIGHERVVRFEHGALTVVKPPLPPWLGPGLTAAIGDAPHRGGTNDPHRGQPLHPGQRLGPRERPRSGLDPLQRPPPGSSPELDP